VRAEHRGVEQRLDQDVAHRVGMQELEHRLQRERMLRPEREQHRVLGGRRLELEIELAAEALPECEAPGPVHPAAERRVDDELHAARLVEEALGDERVLGREGAEQAAGLGEVGEELGVAMSSRRWDSETYPRSS